MEFCRLNLFSTFWSSPQVVELLSLGVRFSYIPAARLTSEKRRWIIWGNRILSVSDNTDLTDVGVKRACWTSRGSFLSILCWYLQGGPGWGFEALQGRVFCVLVRDVRAELCVRRSEKLFGGFHIVSWKAEGRRSQAFTDGRITRIRAVWHIWHFLTWPLKWYMVFFVVVVFIFLTEIKKLHQFVFLFFKSGNKT